MALLTRKKHDKKPTSLPKAFLDTISSLFNKQFQKQRSKADFFVYGEMYLNEVVVCISLVEAKTLAAASFYLSMDLGKEVQSNPEKVTEQLKSMVDVAASWFSQSFEQGKGLGAILNAMRDLSLTWEAIQWEGLTVHVKINRDNHVLEKAADKFLKEKGVDPSELEVDEDFMNEDDSEDPGHLH